MPLVMPKRARLAVVGVAVAGALLAGGPAFAASGATGATGASSAASPAAHAPKGDGAHALCLRVPKLERRIDRALKRLDGGVGVRGSIARLEARVDDAKKANHTAIATYLQDRLNTRKALVGTLQQRQSDLKGVQTWCGANDNGKGAA
ncbi:hypothetical protein DN069_25235 [Streptacidiphilus pinicola]|uniref:Uncharacterized protein n=1 Tax=Streptacidiphilus pinicola TaxID=2219663 RepID=A0A2X0K6I3_9ACTN|nr:hypothetical protein [Streptacidiphilus pinicola]RAG82870.1 hypothetical protein DN069_25235 [Streptacidiphilus pinicola]